MNRYPSTLAGILLIPLLALVGGCGADRSEQNSTKVSFSFAPPAGSVSALTTPIDAGVIVYAVNFADSEIRKAVKIPGSTTGGSGSVSMVLPNGPYRFVAVGYDASGSTALEGVMACGFGAGGATVNLDGTSRTIPIGMSVSTCLDTLFGGPQDFRISNTLANQGAPIAISSCNSTGFAAASGSNDCTGGNAGAFLGSVRIVLPSYDSKTGNFDSALGLSGPCVNISGTPGAMNTTSIKLPLGSEGTSTNIPFFFVVHGFSDSVCSTPYRVYTDFHTGFMSVTGTGITFGAIGAPANNNKLYLLDF